MQLSPSHQSGNLPNAPPKRVLVKFPGGARAPQQVLVQPKATASDLLQHLGLDTRHFVISKGSADTVFGGDEDLHSSLSDGDHLYVTSHVDAGL